MPGPTLDHSTLTRNVRIRPLPCHQVYGKGSIRLGADDNTQLSAREYRQKLYEEIDRRKGEARKEEIAKLKRPSQTVLVVDHR